ncbi:MAG TPA: phosphohistidine phosphatase SixA [Burkholderiales bacterium]|nr:phosphohistidine phosphatase SixA [Burkholderiales bacterium]
MRILLIRHGKAEDRGLISSLSSKKDALRALTQTGKRDMRKAAKGLRKLAPDIDVLLTSPLVRARETAEIVAKVFGVKDVTEQPLLSPGTDLVALLQTLPSYPDDATIALVGHEPDLGHLAAMLLTGKKAEFVVFKKGACALIEFDAKLAAGRGKLSWLFQPGQLRKLDRF